MIEGESEAEIKTAADELAEAIAAEIGEQDSVGGMKAK
jgi:hypothetical protein